MIITTTIIALCQQIKTVILLINLILASQINDDYKNEYMTTQHLNKELEFDNTFHYINKDFKDELKDKDQEILELQLKVNTHLTYWAL